jgi:hypothetical protein
MNKQFRKITPGPEPGPPGREGAGDPAGGQEARDPARTPE